MTCNLATELHQAGADAEPPTRTSAVVQPVRDRKRLRLLAQNLEASDLGKLNAFLRIGSERLRYDWEIVTYGDAHLLIHGENEPETVLGLLENPLLTGQLTDAAAALPGGIARLTRPLQYDSVIELLGRVESSFAKDDAHVDAVAPMLAPAPIPTRAPAIQGNARFRLKRWPTAELLQRSRDYRRMASFLSSLPITASQLSLLANVSRDVCDEFIAELHAAHGLTILQPSADPAPSSGPATTASPEPKGKPAASAASVGLLGRIRQKLGLFRKA